MRDNLSCTARPEAALTFYHGTLAMVFATTVDYRFLAETPGLPSFTLTEVTAYSLALLYCGALAVLPEERLRGLQALRRMGPLPLSYFGWAGLASLLTLSRSMDALQSFKNLIPSVLLFFFVVRSATSSARLKTILCVYVCGVGINVAFGSLQIVFQDFYFSGLHEITLLKTDYLGAPVDRLAVGLFNHPNAFATFLIPPALMTACLLPGLTRRSGAAAALLGTLAVFILFNLYFTQAKGAYAWLLLSTMLLATPRRLARFNFKIAVSILGLGCLGIVSVGVWAFLQGHTQFGTIVTRVQLWISAAVALRQDWIVFALGNGTQAMMEASASYSHMQYGNAHSAILNQALTYGLPGMLLYIFSYLALLRMIAKHQAWAWGFEREVGSFLLASLVAVCGEYVFEPADQTVTLQAQLFFLFALVTVLYHRVFAVPVACRPAFEAATPRRSQERLPESVGTERSVDPEVGE